MRWTIVLAGGCTYDFTAAYTGSATVTPSGGGAQVGLEDWYGPPALPAIATAITIDGSGTTLQATQPASPSANVADLNPDFRFFYVDGGTTAGGGFGHGTFGGASGGAGADGGTVGFGGGPAIGGASQEPRQVRRISSATCPRRRRRERTSAAPR